MWKDQIVELVNNSPPKKKILSRTNHQEWLVSVWQPASPTPIAQVWPSERRNEVNPRATQTCCLRNFANHGQEGTPRRAQWRQRLPSTSQSTPLKGLRDIELQTLVQRFSLVLGQNTWVDMWRWNSRNWAKYDYWGKNKCWGCKPDNSWGPKLLWDAKVPTNEWRNLT